MPSAGSRLSFSRGKSSPYRLPRSGLFDPEDLQVAVPVLPLSQLWFTRFLGPRLGTNVSKELLKAGWAVTYEQKGAVYGYDDVETYKVLEEAAK